jgi:uncharacterized protein (DUF1697 family)
MTTCIALLRAINLPGHNKVGMGDLTKLCGELGLTDARTLLQTGNLVFRSKSCAAARLEASLEQAAKKRLGLDTDFFVRTAEEWKEIVEANPFPKEAKSDPAHLVVMLLKDAPDPKSVTALQDAIKGREVVRAGGRQAYLVYPDGIGRSRLTTVLIEGKLGTRGTGRNWNTVLKLGALAGIGARDGSR